MVISFISSLFRLRLLPVLTLSCALLLSVKIYDIKQGTSKLSNMLASDAIAKDDKENKKEITKDNDKEADNVADAESNELTEKQIKKAETSLDNDSSKIGGYLSNKKQFSQIELDILQSLSERRRDLGKWEDEIKLKENMLEATEARIETKISQIKNLETRVKKVLEEYNQHENEKVKSLVKIYETMKPKDAAVIFNDLEVPVLLMVIDKMSERRIAPIFAKMRPEKARLVTSELSEYRRLRQESEQILK